MHRGLLVSAGVLFAATAVLLPARVLGGPAHGELVPTDGPRYGAHLVAVDAAWNLRFETDSGTRALPAADLVTWGSLEEPSGGVQVLLAGGGILIGSKPAISGERLTIETELFGKHAIPLVQVLGIIVRAPASPDRRDRLAETLLADQRSADRVVLHNGDELTGTIGALVAGEVEISTEAGAVKVAAEKIAAIGFDASLVSPPPRDGKRALVGFRGGSRLLAVALRVENGRAALTTADGETWEADSESITFLQPFGGRATYLSDREHTVYRQVPFLSVAWPFALDRNVAGTPLRAGGRLFAKGIGMHSASRLSYALEGGEQRFEADACLDDHVGAGGSVVFRVFVDQEERYVSPVIRGGDAPVPISVEVSGARQLSLVVDFADRGDELDRANWLNARLVE